MKPSPSPSQSPPLNALWTHIEAQVGTIVEGHLQVLCLCKGVRIAEHEDDGHEHEPEDEQQKQVADRTIEAIHLDSLLPSSLQLLCWWRRVRT